jgi:hypothetical protein
MSTSICTSHPRKIAAFKALLREGKLGIRDGPDGMGQHGEVTTLPGQMPRCHGDVRPTQALA